MYQAVGTLLAVLLVQVGCTETARPVSTKEAYSLSSQQRAALRDELKSGNAEAGLTLGHYWFLSEGNRGCAAYWYRKAADLGHVEAKRTLPIVDDGSQRRESDCM